MTSKTAAPPAPTQQTVQSGSIVHRIADDPAEPRSTRPTAPQKLIDSVAAQTKQPPEIIKEILDTALNDIAVTASTGTLMIRNFGTFYTAHRKGCVRPSPAFPDRIINVPDTQRLALRAANTAVTNEE